MLREGWGGENLEAPGARSCGTSARDTGKPGSYCRAESQALSVVLPGHWGTLLSARGFEMQTPRCFLVGSRSARLAPGHGQLHWHVGKRCLRD